MDDLCIVCPQSLGQGPPITKASFSSVVFWFANFQRCFFVRLQGGFGDVFFARMLYERSLEDLPKRALHLSLYDPKHLRQHVVAF